MSQSAVGELDLPLAEPWDGERVAVDLGFAQDRVMAPAVEGHRQAVVLDRHGPGGLDEPAVEALRIALLEAFQPRRQPAVATVGDHRQRGVEVDVQAHLAGQAVEVEEVHADAQATLDPVAAGVADDQLARGLLEVVGEEQGGPIGAEAGGGDLADRAVVAAKSDRLLDVTDVRMAPFGDIDHGPLPGGGGPLLQASEDGRSAAADGDEVDRPLVDSREFGGVDHLAVQVKPPGVRASDLVPELDESHQFAVLLVAGQIGVGITQASAVLFECEEGQDARPGLALKWEVMAVERRGGAPEGGRMGVEGEPPGLGEEDRGQGLDPALQQAPLLVTAGAIGVVGRERFLGQDVEAGEEAESLVAVKIVDVTAPLLVEQFQRQHREQRAGGGDHRRAGIPRLGDEPIESESSQEGQEEEDTRDSGAKRAAGREVQLAAVRDVRRLGAQWPLTCTRPEGSAAAVREKKGVAMPRRQLARKRLAIDRSVESL